MSNLSSLKFDPTCSGTSSSESLRYPPPFPHNPSASLLFFLSILLTYCSHPWPKRGKLLFPVWGRRPSLFGYPPPRLYCLPLVETPPVTFFSSCFTQFTPNSSVFSAIPYMHSPAAHLLLCCSTSLLTVGSFPPPPFFPSSFHTENSSESPATPPFHMTLFIPHYPLTEPPPYFFSMSFFSMGKLFSARSPESGQHLQVETRRSSARPGSSPFAPPIHSSPPLCPYFFYFLR